MSKEEKFINYESEDSVKLKNQLGMRLARMKKLQQVDAPAFICEKEKRLVMKAMIDMSPDDIVSVIEQFDLIFKMYHDDDN